MIKNGYDFFFSNYLLISGLMELLKIYVLVFFKIKNLCKAACPNR